MTTELSTLECIFVCEILKPPQKIECKNFLSEVATSWISEVQNPKESSFDELQWKRSNQHQWGLNRTPQTDTQGISANTNWTKLLLVGRDERSILQASVKYALHIQSEVKLDTFVNSVLFRFTEGLFLRNTAQLGMIRLFICSFFSTRFRSII